MISCEVVRTFTRFCDLESQWHALWSDARASLFQNHHWIRACVAEDTVRLNMVLAWQGKQLVAVLPLVIRSYAGIRLLEWAGQSLSDYCDALVLDRSMDTVVELLWRHAYAQGGFDVAWMKQISPTAHMASLAHRLDGHTNLGRQSCLQVVRQWPDGKTWFRTLNKKTRNDHLRSKRILAESGEVVFREHRSVEPLDPLLLWVIRLKREWMKKNELSAGPLQQDALGLLPVMVTALRKMEALKIFLLECSGTPIAVSINAVQGGTMLAFVATYDPEYGRGSPGIVLMNEYTMWAFDHGIKVIDYLRGAEHYKFKYANAITELRTLIRPRTLRGTVALKAFQLRQPDKAESHPELAAAYRTASGSLRQGVVASSAGMATAEEVGSPKGMATATFRQAVGYGNKVRPSR